ncbi:MAG: hypothetical protein ACRDVE_18900 [Actinocrinis sp.]
MNQFTQKLGTRAARRVASGSAIVLLAGGVTVGVGAAPAAADVMTPQTLTFTPGTATLTVPPLGTTSITLDALGGAGNSGWSNLGGSGPAGSPGTGGSGTAIHEVIPVGNPWTAAPGEVTWGDTLQIGVGVRGGGGVGGQGDHSGLPGGNGGGATWVHDVTQSTYLLIAGGGGGGGGGGFGLGYTGGNGGTNGNGAVGVTIGDRTAGSRGLINGQCGLSAPAVVAGGHGGNAPLDSDAGGGGGGGDGECAGSGGGDGQQNSGAGGSGGGGGSGGSIVAYPASSTISAGGNTGGGSLSMAWAPLNVQSITSPSVGVVYAGESFQFPVTVSDPAFLPVSFDVSNNPSWLSLTSSTPLVATLQGTAPPGGFSTYSFFVSTLMTASTGPVIVHQVFTLYVMPAP